MSLTGGYAVMHSILILFQVTVLNVAINSNNKALLTVMMSNNVSFLPAIAGTAPPTTLAPLTLSPCHLGAGGTSETNCRR